MAMSEPDPDRPSQKRSSGIRNTEPPYSYLPTPDSSTPRNAYWLTLPRILPGIGCRPGIDIPLPPLLMTNSSILPLYPIKDNQALSTYSYQPWNGMSSKQEYLPTPKTLNNDNTNLR